MTMRTLLIGPRGHGGEGVYLESLYRHPPAGVSYTMCGDFHHGARGARCAIGREVALNQVVHRLTIPDMGFRALRLRGEFDLVHVHAHRVSLTGVNGTPLVMSEGSSSAVYLGDYLGWDDRRLRERYARARRVYRALGIRDRLLALESVTKAYVFSKWAREVNLRWGADPSKLEVLYPGFETPVPVDRVGRDGFTFLFVGGDFERKGGFELVEAFGRLAAEHPDARLMIVGSDPGARNPDRMVHSWVPRSRREQGLALIERLRRDGRLRLERWTDQRRLRDEIFPAADAFVMPTHAEGFGFTNVEAMSFGLPVITSTVGPAAEIVEDGRTGRLVAPGDIEGLTAAMIGLVGDAVGTRRMGDAARAEFEARFTRERFRAGLGDFYRRALDG